MIPLDPRTARRALLVALGATATLAPAPAKAAPADQAPVTQDQYKRTLEILRKVIQKSNQMERELNEVKKGSGRGGGASAPADGAVNLDALSAPTSTATMKSPHRGSGVAPTFKFYFDLNLMYRPGEAEFDSTRGDLSFRNFHSFMFVEMLPDAKLQFSFHLDPTPLFYELDYQFNDRVQLRVGRIWIPFDDLSPHNIFGGRVNVSQLRAPGVNDQFLPNIWADLGVGAKITLSDTPNYAADAHFYVVNGFGSGGPAPTLEGGVNGGTSYPAFTDALRIDNNNDKAIGARYHMKTFRQKFGLGGSVYHGRYTDQGSDSGSINLLGIDTQYRFSPQFEFRAGLAHARVTIPDADPGYDVFTRQGLYGEFGYKWGARNQWKALFRGGMLQLDSRAADLPSDQTLMGGTLVWRPSMIEYSLHVSHDFKTLNVTPDPKTNKTLVNARVIFAL